MALPVTPTWQQAVEAQFRRQGYLRVQLSVIPPGVREGTTPSVVGDITESITSINTIVDGFSTEIEPVVSIEPNRWSGDGTMYLPTETTSDNSSIEWWSSRTMSSQNPLSIDLTFDHAYTIPGITGVWDTETNSWPTDLTITGYDINGSVIHTYHVTDVSRVTQYMDVPFENAKRIRLQINAWSREGWRARITELFFGVVLDIDDYRVLSAQTIDKVSLLNEELPQQTRRLVLRNEDDYFDPTLESGTSHYLAQRQKITWQWGFQTSSGVVEWLDKQTAYIDTINIPAQEKTVTINITNRLALLTETYSRGIWVDSPVDFKSVATSILEHSNVLKDDVAETPWNIPNSVANYSTKAPIPIERVNALLQLIAQASGHILAVDYETGYINFEPSERVIDRTIGLAQELGDPGVEVKDKLRSVKVGVYQYTYSDTATKVYDATFTVNGTVKLDVNYDNGNFVKSPTVTVTGGTLVSSEMYSASCVLTITGNGTVNVTIQGYPIKSSITYIEPYNDPVVANGVDLIIENPFITDTACATAVATNAARVYNLRQIYSVTYTGYPELEALDFIHLVSTYSSDDAVLVSHQIDYNGGWTGKIVAVTDEGE